MKFGKKICSQILRTVTIAALALNVAVPAEVGAAFTDPIKPGYTYKEIRKDTQGGQYAPTYYDSGFYSEADPLYAATHFHIFASDDVKINPHTNGNIATNHMSKGQSNSGTKELAPLEITYVKDFSDINNQILYNANSILVVGPDVTVDSNNGGEGFRIKGSDMVDYIGMDNAHVKNIYQEKKGGDRFIDMEGEFAKLKALSRDISKAEPNVSFDSIYDGKDHNQRSLDVNGMNSKDYLLVDVDTEKLTEGTFIKFRNYNNDVNKKNSLILNVDLANYKDSFVLNSNIIPVDVSGHEENNHERTTWEYGKILWNFYDSSASDGLYHGKIDVSATFFGTILAPCADVVTEFSFDGNVISKTYENFTESHRNDFIGNLPVLFSSGDDNDTTAETTTKETTTVTTTETTTETTTFTTTTQKETDTETTSEEKSDDTTDPDTETDSKDEPSSNEPSGDDTTEPDTEDESKDTEDESKDTEDSSKDTEDSSKDTEDSSKDTEDSSKDTEDSSKDTEDNSQATTEDGNTSDEPAETESEELTETTSEELTETTSEELTQTTTDKDNTDKDNDDDDDSSSGSSSSSSHRGGGSSGGSSSHKADSRVKDETVKSADDDEKTTASDEDTEVTTQEDESTSVSVEENDNTAAGPDDTAAPDDTDVYVPGADTQDVDNAPDSDNAAYSDSAADNSLSESGISVSSDSASKGNVDTLSLNANDSDANSVMQNDSDADSINPKLNDSDSLPQTGSPVNTALLCLVGLAAVGIGMFLVFRSRKKSVR